MNQVLDLKNWEESFQGFQCRLEMSFYLFHGGKKLEVTRGGDAGGSLVRALTHLLVQYSGKAMQRAWTKSSSKQSLLHGVGLLENGERDHTVSPRDRSLPVYAPRCPVVHKKDGTATALKGTSLTHLFSDECTWALVKSQAGLL